jgi:ribose transport system substrate-binding protein
MKKCIVLVLCAVLAVTMFAACGNGGGADSSDTAQSEDAEAEGNADDTGSDADSAKTFKIGLSQEGLDHSYMITQRDQILKAAEEYSDATVEVIATDGQNQVATQVKGIEDMLAQGINLLMVQAAEGEGLKSALAKAEEQGIPYMFVGKPVNGTNAVTMVNNDNYEIGKSAGEWALNHLKEKNGSEKGKVTMITGIPGDQSSEDRTNGFKEVIEKYPDIEVVAEISANYRRPDAFKAAQDILQANPKGSIEVLYATSGEMSIGAAQAIADAGRTGEFPVLSIDGDVATMDEIKKGTITAAWTYEPCGTSGFEYAMKILNGETVDPQIIIPTRIIDESNVDSSEPAF